MTGRPSGSSRRGVLAGLAGAALGGPAMAADADPRVAEIVAGITAVDMHSHMQVQLFNDPADALPYVPFDLAGEMKRAGFAVICQTYALDSLPFGEPGFDYRHNLQALAFEDRLLAQNGMRRALNIGDVRDAHARGQPIIVQSMEGAQFLEGRLERLDEVYRRGLRHLQLLHEVDDVARPLGDFYTAPAAHLGGLTSMGADVIGACNRLGIVVDLAHGTDEMVTKALRVATQPLIVSHTSMLADLGPNAPDDRRRRVLTDETALAVAKAGGVVGSWSRMFGGVKAYVAALKAKAAMLGADHVGIGTDTDLSGATALPHSAFVLPYTNKTWPDQSQGLVFAVVEEMLRQDFAREDIAKICGGNFLRVFATVTSARASVPISSARS